MSNMGEKICLLIIFMIRHRLCTYIVSFRFIKTGELKIKLQKKKYIVNRLTFLLLTIVFKIPVVFKIGEILLCTRYK